MGSVLLLKCSLCRVLQLLDVVDRGELADGGLDPIIRAVVHSDLAGSGHGQEFATGNFYLGFSLK